MSIQRGEDHTGQMTAPLATLVAAGAPGETDLDPHRSCRKHFWPTLGVDKISPLKFEHRTHTSVNRLSLANFGLKIDAVRDTARVAQE
jgi:hypothetical protein